MLASLLLGTLALPLQALQDDPPGWERDARRAIAEAELMVEADRDLEGAAQKLAATSRALVQRLEQDPGDVVAQRLLVDATFMWVIDMDRLGRTDVAYQALDDLLFGAAREGRKASPLQLAGAARAEDERLRTAHARLARRVGGDPGAASLSVVIGQDIVDQRVRDALGHNSNFIMQLGKRATPGLVQALGRELDQFPGNPDSDAFYLLTRLDPAAASEFAGENVEFDGFFWRKRLLRSMQESKVFLSDLSWDGPEYPSTCRLTGFVRCVEQHLDDPDVGDSMLALVAPFVNRGAQTARMQEALIAALESDDGARRATAEAAIKGKRGVENMRSFYERMLASTDPSVRALGAAHMLSLPECDALYALATDPDVSVRFQVAQLLRSRRVYAFGIDPDKPDAGPDWYAYRVGPRWDARDRRLAEQLAGDENAGVYRLAITAILELDTLQYDVSAGYRDKPSEVTHSITRYAAPLPAAVYLRLARHSDLDMRREIFRRASQLPWPVEQQVLEVLCDDAVANLAHASAASLLYGEWWLRIDASLALLARNLDRPDSPLPTRHAAVAKLIHEFKKTDAGLAAVAAWALARDDDELLRMVAYRAQGSRSLDPQLAFLPPDLHVQFVTRFFAIDPGRALEVARGARSDEQRRAFAAVAANASLPAGLRYIGATTVGVDAGYRNAMRAVLADPSWQSPPEWLAADIVKHMPNTPPELRNELLLQVIGDSGFEDVLAEALAQHFREDASNVAAVTRAILERWFDATDLRRRTAVNKVLASMGQAPALADVDVLTRAARSAPYHHTAFKTIGALKDPVFLPVIESVLRTQPGSEVFREAAKALPGYLSDEAAELLLVAAAGAQDAQLRDWCMTQLERIREYQDARERWATRRVRVQTRAEVIGELTLLLDDADAGVRIEAIRGLATWEAVEAMPRLIRLTKDAHADVAAAAKAALAKLNETPAAGDE
jgi:hypothetical protein